MRSKKLIEDNNKNKSTYAGTLANHIPMSLVALDYLDANRFTLGKYYKEAKERMSLEEFGDEQITKEITPELDRGNPNLELSWRAYIEDKLEEHAPREILNELFPLLIKGVATGAFHPLIRLSYALETHNQDEFIAAMAYWASHYDELNNQTSQKIVDPVDLREHFIEATDANFADPIEVVGDTIFDKMKHVSLSKQFNERAHLLEMDFDEYLSQSSLNAAVLFSRDFDFTALHITTSCMALRIVGDYLSKENKALAVQHHYHAFSCAHYVIGAPRITQSLPSNDIDEDWKTINKNAVQTLDDHVLKMTYMCLKEAQHYKRPFYKTIASRYIKHFNTPKP